MAHMKELVDAIEKGREASKSRKKIAVACDHWLRAWDLVKQLAAPVDSSIEQFDDHHLALPEPVYNWCQEFLDHLWNVALDDPKYQPLRLQYVDEFLTRFPDTDPDLIQSFMQAKGESLEKLGRKGEAEHVFNDLVDSFPNDGRAYLARSDQFWPFGPPDAPKNHERAEELILSALGRPGLLHRDQVIDRLESLYEDWGKPDKRAAVAAQRVALVHGRSRAADPPSCTPAPATSAKVGRNDPCPCGSGKKFKQCCLGKAAKTGLAE